MLLIVSMSHIQEMFKDDKVTSSFSKDQMKDMMAEQGTDPEMDGLGGVIVQSLLQMYSSPHASLDRMWLNNLLVTGTVVSKDGEWWYIAWSHTVGAIGWELENEVEGTLFWVLEQTRSNSPLKVLAVIEEGDYTVNTITVLSKTM